MANGNVDLEDVDKLARFLQGNGFVGPLELDEKTRKSASVVDTTKAHRPNFSGGANTLEKLGRGVGEAIDMTAEQLYRAINEGLLGGRAAHGSTLSERFFGTEKGTKAATNRGLNIPDTIRRRESDPVTDSINQEVFNASRVMEPEQKKQTNDPIIRALTDDSSINRVSEEEFAQGRNTLENFLSSQDFEGAKIEGQTPKGIPEPEEMSDLGKALSSIGKAFGTPGVQKMLAQIGISLSDPGRAGEQLGQAAIGNIESRAENELFRMLQEGEEITPDIIRQLGASTENVRNAIGLAQQQQQLNTQEKDTESKIETREERLNIMGQELGLQEDQIDINRFDAITRRMQAIGAIQEAQMDTEDVSSAELGMGFELTAAQFKDAAIQNMVDETGVEDIQKIQQALEGPDGNLDPAQVFAHLNDRQRELFTAMAPKMANSIARSAQDITKEGGFDIPTNPDAYFQAPEVSDVSEAANLPMGSIVSINGENRIVTTNDKGEKVLRKYKLDVKDL